MQVRFGACFTVKKNPIHTRCYVCRSYKVVTTPLSSERAVHTRYVCSDSNKLTLITLTLTLAATGSRILEPRPLGTLRLATQKQTTCQRRSVVKNKTIEGQNAWCECSAHRQTRSCPRKYPLLSPQVKTHIVIDMLGTRLFLRIFAKYYDAYRFIVNAMTLPHTFLGVWWFAYNLISLPVPGNTHYYRHKLRHTLLLTCYRTRLFLRIFAKYLWHISIYCECNVAATYAFGCLVVYT